MKRYAYSTCYDDYNFQYDGRTDDPERIKNLYHRSLENWIKELNDESYPYRGQTNYRFGLRITDSKTKEVVFEEIHTAEEYGWNVIKEIIRYEYGQTQVHRFEKI